MNIRRIDICVLLLSALIPASLAWAQDDDLLHIESEEGTYDWVVHAESGRLFASSTSKGEVIEFSAGMGTETRRFSVGAEPKELLIKGDYLIAGCTKSPSLTIIDLKTNKVAGSVELAGKGPYGMFCSQADNSYVYAICNTGTAWWDGEVFQVDLKDKSVRNRVGVHRNWGQSHPLHVAMSPDGNWIVPDARGASSPSGADLMRVDEEKCTFTQIRDHHSSFGQMVAGPWNRYWTFGNRLYPLDIKESIREFTGSPVAIHPYLDLVASLKTERGGRVPSELWLETFSSAKMIKSIKLGPLGGDDARALHDPNLQFDAAGRRVYCAWRKHAYIFNLADLDPKNLQPLLMIDTPSSVEVTVGDTLRSKLNVTNAKLAAATRFELVSAPDGAQVAGSELVWKPTADAVGEHDVVVKATSGEMTDSITVTAKVSLPTIPLDFVSTGLNVDREGKFAIVWGPQLSEDPRQQIRGSSGGPVNYVVIDLEKKEVVARQRLTAGVKSLSIDDKYLYLVPATGNVIYRAGLTDASDRKRLFLNAPVTHVFSLPQGAIALRTHDGRQGEMQVYDRATLKRLPDHPANRTIGYADDRYGQSIEGKSRDNLKVFESIVDAETGDLRCFIAPPQLPSLVQATPVNNLGSRTGGTEMWGRRLAGTTLMNGQGTRITNWSAQATTISQSVPLAISLRQEPQGRTQRLIMEQRDLVLGAVVQSNVLDIVQGTSNVYRYSNRHQLQTAGDKIVATDGFRVYVSKLDPEQLKDLARPLHLAYPQIPLASAEKPLEFQLSATGGKGKKAFALVSEFKGVNVNESTGVVQLDMPALWKDFIDGAVGQMTDFRTGRNFKPLIAGADEKFKSLTGKSVPEGKLAVTVPLHVAVTDDEGQQDRQMLYVVALGPRKQLDDVLAAHEQQLADAREKAQREAQQRRQEMEEKRQAELAAQGGTEGDRLDALEKRVRRIEATLDAILEKLDDQGAP